MKLFVATPAYAGNVHVNYMKSMLSLQTLLYQKEIGMTFFSIGFESLIPRARNVCAMQFLKSDCTHMLFIDADIAFDASSIIDMLNENKGVICGIYAKKSINFEGLKQNADKSIDLQELVERSARYNVNYSNEKAHVNGVVEVLFAPTGFMLINKNELELFVKETQVQQYRNDIRSYGFGGMCYDIFKCGVIDGRYLSEDYYFCHLWRVSGRQIFADLRPRLAHVGSFIYYGNPLIAETTQSFDK